MIITIAGPSTQALQRARIEGPSRRQAGRMAAYRLQCLAWSAAALEAGDDDNAFEHDCEAFDVEAELIAYGFGRLLR